MASKITLFEPHFDGPLFGGDCDCDGHGHSAKDRDPAGADPGRDGPNADSGCCPAKSIGLVALGILTVVIVAITVRRAMAGPTEDGVPTTASD